MKNKINLKNKELNNSLRLNTDFNLLLEKVNAYKKFMPDIDLDKQLDMSLLKEAFETGFIDSNLFKDMTIGIEGMIISMFRAEYISRYGFVAITKSFIKDLSSILINKKVVEIGAGTGFLAKKLKDTGVDLIAVDANVETIKINTNDYSFNRLHTEIIEKDCVSYLEKNKLNFNTVLMAWTPYNEEMATNVWKELEIGQTLVYIGESYGGCTASNSFFKELEKSGGELKDLSEIANKNFLSFPYIRDCVLVYQKIR